MFHEWAGASETLSGQKGRKHWAITPTILESLQDYTHLKGFTLSPSKWKNPR